MLKKRSLKTRPVCKVTFTLPEHIDAETAAVVGDFNEWNPSEHQMRQLKNGKHKVTIDLDRDCKYQFRYLVDGETWYNDGEADSYVANEFGGQNGLIIT